jgi:hypothetical protein
VQRPRNDLRRPLFLSDPLLGIFLGVVVRLGDDPGVGEPLPRLLISIRMSCPAYRKTL